MSGGSTPQHPGPVGRVWVRWRQAGIVRLSWWCCAAALVADVTVAAISAAARAERWAGARPVLFVVLVIMLVGAAAALVRLHPEQQRMASTGAASAPEPPGPGWITWSIPRRAELRQRHAATTALRRALVAGDPIDPASRPWAGEIAHGTLAQSTTQVVAAGLLLGNGALQVTRAHPDPVWIALSVGALIFVLIGQRGAARWRRIATDARLVDPPSTG